jgi:signal transduction histidine kinase
MKNLFNKARIKLTMAYLVIIILISLFFSFNIYGIMSRELERGPRMMRIPNQETITQEIKKVITKQLMITNMWILVLSSGAGYFLAGMTLKPIEEAMEEQKRFISDASHELRTPLTAIKTETEVTLRDKKLDLKSAKKQLISNLEEVEKLKKLTDYLLRINKNIADNKEEFDLKEVIQKITLRMKIRIELKGQAKIVANKMAIEELLTILLDNSVKYGGKNGKISVTIKPHLIEVRDDGIGIRKSDIPHIFDRFYRADTSRTKNKIEGYGLGLAIAKNIVDSHKGKIEVESEVGKGSVFRVMI